MVKPDDQRPEGRGGHPSEVWLRWVKRVCVLLLASTTAAMAERHALLVGVSAYPNLPADKQLRGPANDVSLMREVLLRKGFAPDRIRVVSDQVPGGALPTRENILGALTSLARAARSGDFVVLYMAGHGSQMPSGVHVPAQYRRPDGRQGLFLPRDAAKWNGEMGRVPNAIADYELTSLVDEMRSRGAFVWAVVDACHSAALMRGSVTGAAPTERFLSTEELGIPTGAFAKAGQEAEGASGLLLESRAGASRGAEPPQVAGAQGGYVAFYAAQQHETTPEERLPGDRDEVRGLFSYWVAAAMRWGTGATYRQLGDYVLQQYAAKNRRIPTPQFTGTHLDAVAFGESAGARVQQWPLEEAHGELTIGAGMLNQLSDGAVVALVGNPLASGDSPLGYAHVIRADLLRSTLKTTAYRGKPAVPVEQIPKGSYARLLQPAVGFTLRVAYEPAQGGPGAAAVRSAVEALQRGSPADAGIRMQWVRPTEGHDIRLELAAGRLWLVSTGERRVMERGPGQTPSLGAEQPGLVDALKESLARIGKALNILRLAAAVHAGANARNLGVTVELERGGVRVPLETAKVASLVDNDRVLVTVQNRNPSVAVDLTALYVDRRYGVTALWAGSVEGTSSRLPAQNNSAGTPQHTFAFRIRSRDAAGNDASGLERLVLIAVDAVSGRRPYDFRHLQQERLEVQRGQVRDEVESLFDQAGFGIDAGDSQRGQLPLVPLRLQMEVLSFRVLSVE